MGTSFKLALAAAALSASAPALAGGPSITYVPDSNVVQGTIFQDFEAGAHNAQFVPGARESKSGDVRTLDHDEGGIGVGPHPDAGGFLSILANGSYSVLAQPGTQLVSFLIGTLDTYNTVTLVTNLQTYILNGREIFGQAPVPGEPANLLTLNQGSVTYNFSGSEYLSSIMFSSSNTAMELDSVAFAAPEASTWMMMIFGFGVAGAAMRRRKRKLAFA